MRNAQAAALIALAISTLAAAAAGRDVLWAAGAPPVEQNPPRDLRPGEPRPATKQELDLQDKSSLAPDPASLLALAKLQDARGAVAEAEATLLKIRHLDPANAAGNRALAALYLRSGRFERAVETLEQAAALNSSDAAGHHLVGTYYFEKTRDATLAPADRLTYIQRGIAAEDRALASNPDYVEALVYKNLFLRTQATMEADAASQQALVAEADALRARAMQLRQSAAATTGADRSAAPGPPPPPPPPPPGAPGDEARQRQFEYGRVSFTVAGSATPPVKIKDARPVYPPMAIRAGVRGAVVVEATVDDRGRIADARITQSIPMLDQSAIDAVKQWEFEPRTPAGAVRPVVITVTVDFAPAR